MKVYAGAPAAARHYLAADRGRADDYYLTEGTGIARRFTAGPGGPVVELSPLNGNAYETWVAGVDPETGVPRGRLRTDARAVRFVEVVVNGPKSWSLAAALHPDIAAAYDAAQDRAAAEILRWLGEHATTRVGPAGGQVQVPVERLEAVTVRHYTSRAGDPHRHLHLQINARVFAAGKWRGLHTVGVRDSLAAINGIGHAAVATDPQFRAALAAHGYQLDRTGEILQLAEYVGPFSARAAQIRRNADRYERDWTAAHPGETPGAALRRRWDARAWAEGRPHKVFPRPGANLGERWLVELAALGYRDLDTPVTLTPTPVGVVARDSAAGTVLARLGAARSAWNPADVRGEVEQLLAAQGIVADAAVRIELAEDVTARALARCVPLLTRNGVPVQVPEHIRALTSRAVLDVEADLTDRLAARSAADRSADASLTQPVRSAGTLGGLDAGQAAAVAALAGTRPLVVVEGAAGAGKTTALAATRTALESQGRRLVVVTPTLKAASVVQSEVGAAAGSAAAFVHAYGWRWTDGGAWTRLDRGESDPVNAWIYMGPPTGARLEPGDLLVIDEAGMLDQDTARALLTIADECQARVALLGDRRQLAAVGRGGVLDLAVARVDPAAHLILEEVHRFVSTDAAGRRAPDAGYAELTLAMRTGNNPGAVFDALVARGQIRLHPDVAALQETLAQLAATASAAGQRPAVVADTRESVAVLNAAIRSALVAAGKVDDNQVATTFAGQRIGVGDRITTRRNDHRLGVANRDTWTVTDVGSDGRLGVTPSQIPPAHPAQSPSGSPFHTYAPLTRGDGPSWVLLQADYVASHVELAYASTAHGVQGDTVPAAHLVVGEHTGAAAAYVGMTRGRETNTAHLVAADLEEAREQWIAAFARDRADLGPAHAGQLAATEAARYCPGRPLEQVLAELHAAWTDEQHDLQRLAALEPERDTLRQVVGIEAPHVGELAHLSAARQHTARVADDAQQRVEASAKNLIAQADQIRDALLARWDSERAAASAAARVIRDGPGRFRFGRGQVTRAGEELTAWADRWRPHVPTLPNDRNDIARVAGWSDNREALWQAFNTSARAGVVQAHPEHAQLSAAAQAAHAAAAQARRDLTDARAERDRRLAPFGSAAWTPNPAGRLADLEHDIAGSRQQLTDTQTRITTLTAEPALHGQPPDRLTRERDCWQTRRDTERHERQAAHTAKQKESVHRRHRHEEHHTRSPGRPGHGIGR